jgi:hypothetical protein
VDIVIPIEPAPTPATPEEEIDYKKKYSDSSREAMSLHFKNAKLTEKIEEAGDLPDPTIDELKAYARVQGASYDDLDEFSQNVLKENLIGRKRFELIRSASVENKNLDQWAGSVDAFINSSDAVTNYPSIQDNEAEFKKFCMKESRRGMDMEDLVASFMFKRQDEAPVVKRPKQESILLTGGGSSEAPAKPKEITAEEARIIRTKNPKRYEQLVKEGKVGLSLLDRE